MTDNTELTTTDEQDQNPIVLLAESLSVDMNVSIEDRMNRAIEKTNQALRLVIEAGIDYISVKNELPHGEFEKFLEDRNVSSQRASDAMAFAQFAASQSEADRTKLLTISKSKAMLLARTDNQVIEQLLEESEAESIEDLDQLSVRDMRQKIRELQAQKADLVVENETKQVTIKALNDRAAKARNFNEHYPDFVNIARDESNALSNEVLLRFDELERLTKELQEVPPETDAHMLSIAATSLHIHITAIAARASKLSRDLGEHFGELITELKSEHMLNPEEIEQAIMDRNTMTQEMEQLQRIREDRREAAKPAKRGRPTNKSKEQK